MGNVSGFRTVPDLIAGALGGAVIGAVVLPVLMSFFGVFVVRNANHSAPFLYGSLVGAVLGALAGYRKSGRKLRRQTDRQDASQTFGLRSAGNPDAELLGYLQEFFQLPDRGVLFRDVDEGEIVGGRLLMGDLAINMSIQTVAYFASDVLEMPSFILKPESRSLYVFSKSLNLRDIDFESHRDFARYYDLSASPPDLARLLFNNTLLAYFTQHPGLQVMANDHRLVVFRPGQKFEGVGRDQFWQLAMEVFTQFQEAASLARERLASAPGCDAQNAAQQLGPLARTHVRRRSVTSRDIDRFLAQPTPRNVPANIRRQRLGSTSALFAFIGPLIAAGGLVLSVTAGFIAGATWNMDRISPIIVGAAFALVGGLSGLYAWRYRIRNMRLLTHGRLAKATIERIEATDEYVGYEQQHRVQFQFEASGRPHVASSNLGGRAAREAKQLAKAGSPVRLLYDRNHPSRILWVESMITASNE